MTTTSKIALGILGAAAAGLIIGLMVAPGNGKETRKKIKDTTGTWVNNLGRLFTKTKAGGNKKRKKMESMLPA
jgi:gas vesicle protein